MSSTLQRLFRFAKATGHNALENFTTEALAAAIKHDATPMAHVLADDASRYEILTQIPIDAGILDLLLRSQRSFVVEVKVEAGQSGDQIARYVKWARAQTDVSVVVLGPRKITDDASVQWITWRQLRAAVRASGTTSVYWHDLVTFLEEIGMADDSLDPVGSEANMVTGAHLLLKKMIHVLREPATHINTLLPKSNWPTSDSEIKNRLVSRFGARGRFTVSNRRRFRAGISMGTDHEESGDAWLAVWIWSRPNRVLERERLVRKADTAGLMTAKVWEQSPGEWELIGAYERLVDFKTLNAASKWVIARIDELNAAQIFSTIEQLGAPAPEDAPDPSNDGDESELLLSRPTPK